MKINQVIVADEKLEQEIKLLHDRGILIESIIPIPGTKKSLISYVSGHPYSEPGW